MNKKPEKLILLLLIGLVLFLSYYFDIHQFASIEYLSAKKNQFTLLYNSHPFVIAFLFFLIYLSTVALAIPLASALTLISGAIFDFPLAVLLVSFASTLGASLSFVLSRFILKDWVQNKYQKELKKINNEFSKDGLFYLFALRLVPAFPFFIVNILVAMLPIKLFNFYWVSQISMLPATLIYIYAGMQIAQITSASEILSLELIAIFSLLGIFPLLMKKILVLLKSKKC